VALTQARAFGAHTGSSYGAFAGKGDGAHPVGALTHPRASGAYSGRRYGSFAGRAAPPALTQCRAFGAFSGGRYGSFAGRLAVVEPPPTDTGVYMPGWGPAPRKKKRRNDDEEVLLFALLS
jgi:hypothetical protein